MEDETITTMHPRELMRQYQVDCIITGCKLVLEQKVDGKQYGFAADLHKIGHIYIAVTPKFAEPSELSHYARVVYFSGSYWCQHGVYVAHSYYVELNDEARKYVQDATYPS